MAEIAATLVNQISGSYYDACYNGRLFSQDSDQQTITSAFVTKSALGTVKLINGIYNPVGNTKLAVLRRVSWGSISGTPGGPLMYNFYTGITVNSAATGTIRPRYLTAAVGSTMLACTNVVITTIGAATNALLELGCAGGPGAIALGAGNNSIVDELNGSVIVPPGCIFGLTATATGTTHIVQSEMVWEEVPI